MSKLLGFLWLKSVIFEVPTGRKVSFFEVPTGRKVSFLHRYRGLKWVIFQKIGQNVSFSRKSVKMCPFPDLLAESQTMTGTCPCMHRWDLKISKNHKKRHFLTSDLEDLENPALNSTVFDTVSRVLHFSQNRHFWHFRSKLEVEHAGFLDPRVEKSIFVIFVKSAHFRVPKVIKWSFSGPRGSQTQGKQG